MAAEKHSVLTSMLAVQLYTVPWLCVKTFKGPSKGWRTGIRSPHSKRRASGRMFEMLHIANIEVHQKTAVELVVFSCHTAKSDLTV